jgi:predicted DNA binding protein
MSVITTIEVAAEDFALEEALSSNPGIRVRLERVIPFGSSFIPYFWASDDDTEAIEGTLVDARDIESFRVVDRVDDEALFRVEWREETDGALDALVETGGTILEATGEDGVWTIQVRFDDHSTLTAFYRECSERGVPLEVRSVHNPGIPEVVDFDVDLTDKQHEALSRALEAGYFDVPRRVNLTELAAELGVSDTAASQRIRRGIATLLVEKLPGTGTESTADGGRTTDDG